MTPDQIIDLGTIHPLLLKPIAYLLLGYGDVSLAYFVYEWEQGSQGNPWINHIFTGLYVNSCYTASDDLKIALQHIQAQLLDTYHVQILQLAEHEKVAVSRKSLRALVLIISGRTFCLISRAKTSIPWLCRTRI
jgi:hypothetical protein